MRSRMIPGSNAAGASAYEIAVADGFVGSETDWLLSLQGPPGVEGGRHVQTITIGGSKDYLYPVFWRMPGNEFGVARLEISRHFTWNRDTRPLDPLRPHQAALLLSIEGNAYPWNGDANYLRVHKYHWGYNKTASHLQFGGFANRRSTDDQPPAYGVDGYSYGHSGIYLRGGGLDYRFSSNWPVGLLRLPDEDDPASELVLHTFLNTQFYAERIPFSDLIEPVEG